MHPLKKKTKQSKVSRLLGVNAEHTPFRYERRRRLRRELEVELKSEFELEQMVSCYDYMLQYHDKNVMP